MIRFNVFDIKTGNSLGYLDIPDPEGIQFKRRNVQFFFGKMEIGRSTEFSVPATDHNKLLLQFGNDPEEYGTMLRQRVNAQMQTSGNAVDGILAVTEYTGNAFKCVFYYETDPNLEKINNVKLADLYCSFKGVTWDTNQPAWDSDDPTVPTTPIQLVKYRNNWSESGLLGLQWYWAPSVSLKLYIEDLLTNLGVPYSIYLPDRYRFIAPSMHGSGLTSGTIAKTGMTAGTIDAALSNFFEFNTSARLAHRNSLIGWTYTSCWSIKCKQALLVTFPASFPNNYELITVNGNNITFTTDRYIDSQGWHGEPLAGRTIEMAAGAEFFIVTEQGYPYDNSYIRGWKQDESPFSFTFTVARSGDISLGETWYVQNNPPDMTLVDLLRSAALLTGQELYYDPVNGVCIGPQDVGSVGNFDLEQVVSIDSVSREVKDWGSNKTVTVHFDSEDYVEAPLIDYYEIDNANLEGTDENVIKFSEGMAYPDGSGDIYLEDVSINGTEVKMVAKKPTIAVSGIGEYMDRVRISSYDGNAVIAQASTSVVLRAVMDLDFFLRITRDAIIRFQGVAYVWMSGTWGGGVATLNLQKYT